MALRGHPSWRLRYLSQVRPPEEGWPRSATLLEVAIPSQVRPPEEGWPRSATPTTAFKLEGKLAAQLDCAATEVARAVVIEERAGYIGKRKRYCADPELIGAVEVVLIHKER